MQQKKQVKRDELGYHIKDKKGELSGHIEQGGAGAASNDCE